MQLLCLAGALAVFACTAPVAAQEVEIAEIRAQLFYEYSGTLSENILDPARDREFVGWNTIIGEGDAREPADNLLVTVVMRTVGHRFIDEPLEIWVTDEAGVTLASRTSETLLTSNDGVDITPLFVEDIGCAGILTLHARFRDEHETAQISLFCGD